MFLGNNRGFCGTMEPLILVAVFAIILAVMIGVFTDRARVSDTSELYQLISEKTAEYQLPDEDDETETEKENSPVPEVKTAAANIQVEDGRLSVEYSKPEPPQPGDVLDLASGITASIYEDRIEIVEKAGFFTRFILLPGLILISVIGIIGNIIMYIEEKGDGASAVPMVIIVLFFIGLGTGCLWGIMHKKRIAVNAEGVEYSTAGFGGFAPGERLEAGGFARRESTEELLCLFRDEEGGISGEPYCRGADKDNLLRVIPVMNRFLPDSPLKRFLRDQKMGKEDADTE